MRHLLKELGELESLGRMQDIVQRHVWPREAKISDSVKLSAWSNVVLVLGRIVEECDARQSLEGLNPCQ